jgi:hypothetical protein
LAAGQREPESPKAPFALRFAAPPTTPDADGLPAPGLDLSSRQLDEAVEAIASPRGGFLSPARTRIRDFFPTRLPIQPPRDSHTP